MQKRRKVEKIALIAAWGNRRIHVWSVECGVLCCTCGVLVLQVAKKCMQKRRKVEKIALIAAWGNRRIHDKTDKSRRNADVYADIAKGVKEKWLS